LGAIVVGEPGAPTRAVARLIHEAGPPEPSDPPWVEIRCEGVAEALIEAELFGPPTDAFPSRTPAAERARGGTLFIDPISSAGPTAQARLVGAFRSQPGGQPRGRLIASSYADPRVAVRQRRLRADLLDQLSTIAISIPPLRTRSADIERLAAVYAQAEAATLARPFDGFTPGATAKLLVHPFRENEAELRRIVRRALVLAEGATVDAPSIVFDPVAAPLMNDIFADTGSDFGRGKDREPPTLGDVERAYVLWMLKRTRRNRTAAARLLGISYPTLVKKIADFGIDLASLEPDESRDEP
jgi:DNA-binding NtrC family response regulator